MSWQQTIIIGNVGRDAELKYTPGGIAVCDFSVAVSKTTGTGDSKKEKTFWFKVTCWRERAETAAKYVKKGMLIQCIGDIAASAYINKEGQPTASLELTAYNFQFLSRAKGDEDTVGYTRKDGHEIPIVDKRSDPMGEESEIPF